MGLHLYVISDLGHSWLPNQGSRAEFQIFRKHSRIVCLHFVGFLEMRCHSFRQSLTDIHDPEIQELLVHYQWQRPSRLSRSLLSWFVASLAQPQPERTTEESSLSILPPFFFFNFCFHFGGLVHIILNC